MSAQDKRGPVAPGTRVAGRLSRVIALVLASASSARLRTLHRAGIRPRVVVSGVDEDAVLQRAQAERGPLAARDVALLLARAKAEQVAGTLTAGGEAEAGLVLGCDSVLELDGEVMGKPHTAAVATRRWRQMRGRVGVLHSGHWLLHLAQAQDRRPKALGATASTRVHFARLDDSEIEDYVATGEPLEVAGGFTVDGLGGAYVAGIEGDYHAVVGLSLPLLRLLVRDAGLDWPALRSG